MNNKKEKIVEGVFLTACGLWILRVVMLLIIDGIRFCNMNYGCDIGDRLWFDIIRWLPPITILCSIIGFSLYNKYSLVKRIAIFLGLVILNRSFAIIELIYRWEWNPYACYLLHTIFASFVRLSFFVILPMVLVSLINGRLGKFETSVKSLILMVWCGLWMFVVCVLT